MNDGSNFNVSVSCKDFPPIPSVLDLDILSVETIPVNPNDPPPPRNPIIALDQGPQWDPLNPETNVDRSFFLYLPNDIRIEGGFLTEENTFGDKEIKFLKIIEDQNPIPHLLPENDHAPYLYSLEV